MQNNPLVSIIIPTYNRAHLIGETLDSVLEQTYTNWECIVVDDGSTDNTEEIVNKYIKKDNRFQYHLRPEYHKSGGNGARNYGFDVSKGELVQWFDDDDVMLSFYLQNRVENFTKGDFYFVICTGYFWDDNTQQKNKIMLKSTNNIYLDYLDWSLMILTPSVMFKKDFLLNKNLFSDEILRGQESEFFLRLFFDVDDKNYKIIEESLFLYRRHFNTKSTQSLNYNNDFKNSFFKIMCNNYKRCSLKNEKRGKYFCYKKIVDLFFDSLHHKHYDLSSIIIKDFFSLLKKEELVKYIEIAILSRFFYVIKRGSFKVRNRWMKFNFN